MNQNGWGFSSSSDSDTDCDDQPITIFRTDTKYYRDFQNGEYGADWPQDVNNQHAQLNHSNASETNDIDSSHFVRNNSCDLNDSRILSPRTILDATCEDIVLIKDGDKLRPMRVISSKDLLPPRISPDAKPKQYETIVKKEMICSPRDIPLEIIDFIDAPIDPRVKKFNYCITNYDHPMPLPVFWRETIVQSEQARNRERNGQQNGSYKRSNSYIRERTEKALQRRQRVGVAQRRDPRLDKGLFTEPPRKISSPKKTIDTSRKRKSTSIFENNGVLSDVSSDSSSLTPTSKSCSSPSNFTQFEGFSSAKTNNVDLDSLSSDEDCSFISFKNRKTKSTTKQAPKTSLSNKEKVSPIRIDLRKKRVTANSNKKDLFGVPPTVDKDAILQALTDTTSEDQENIISKANKVTKKVEKKSKIESKKRRFLPVRDSRNTSVNYANESPDKMVQDDHEIQAIKKTGKSDASVVIHDDAEIGEKVDKLDGPLDETLTAPLNGPSVATEVISSESLSNTSLSSIGSIERRLAEMTSPLKSATRSTETTAEMIEENLANILSTGSDIVEPMEAAEILNSEIADIPPTEDTDINNELPLTLSTASGNPSIVTSPQSNDETQNATDQMDTMSQMDTDSISQEATTEDEYKTNADPPTNENAVDIEAVPSNSVFDVPEIGANTEIFGLAGNINLDEYTKGLDTTSDTFDIIPFATCSQSHVTDKDGANNKIMKRPRIIIDDFSENEAVTTPKLLNDVETSDDDYEDDIPCSMDALTLPNSNTDRNAVNKLEPNCRQCSYQVTKGWKQLTKHYVRKHPEKEIPISFLANTLNLQNVMATPFTPVITNGSTETLIQSLCYICDEGFNMSSSNWLMHFIAHTGEFEFRCNKCHKVILHDLHKKCNSKENKRIKGPFQFIDNALYGYVCAICNYIQLTKTNVSRHLDNEHQTIITDDQNIHEIILLKISQADFLTDSKFNESLTEAKKLITQSTRYMNMDYIAVSDDEVEPENPLTSIDLTLSDDDI